MSTLACRRLVFRRPFLSAPPSPSSLSVLGQSILTDDYTNVTPAILSKLPIRLWEKHGHPLCTLRSLVESHFSDFASLSAPSPLVTPAQNFDVLSFPPDHPGRARSDSYYLNRSLMLRTHASTHQVESFAKEHDRWLLTADVYRRDEIDASHYPVFHQMEGGRVFGTDTTSLKILEEENRALEEVLERSPIHIVDAPHYSPTNPVQAGHSADAAALVSRSLKLSLNGLMLKLFGGASNKDEPLQVRWIEAEFPFTSPSFEVEVFFRGKWLEILGSGVVLQSTLDRANVPGKIGWAFGLGLERIAMILFSIPDIRLFWTSDERFHSQFSPNAISTFVPYSKYPAASRDISFWLGAGTHDNDVYDVVRDVVGDVAEDVVVLDRFTHPKTGRRSATFRITYRSMERSLVGSEVSAMQGRVRDTLIGRLGVEMR
ncbi:hypothetical protein K488DRAFT_76464 [Vararia minispora EC-137]|uniref:Uncharacterized protein n=1 Tax=Vararia minispora EC-137 TaxID=1314806 RepID=A0ACB8QW53_9AGAM|nr:hypothetical protein K488DRAFT_76464 [Vararia minispora EC-137]